MKYIVEFTNIKEISEKYWENITINNKIYGYQIQKGTKWKKGLSINQLEEYQNIMGFEFPEILKDFYTIMNGIDKEQVNIYGNSGYKYSYSKEFYSFPDDIKNIKKIIKLIYNENNINEDEMIKNNISRIFPIFSHRFILIDHKEYPILSMNGKDIILYANNIIDLLYMDLNIKGINVKNVNIKYWLDNI